MQPHQMRVTNQPMVNEAKPIHCTLARFLEVSVLKHSRFPGAPGNRSFYHKLISATSTPINLIVLSMLYMTKLRTVNSPLLDEYPGQLVYTACLQLAFGIADDVPYATRSWSTLSGYSLKQINSVIRSILHALDYRLEVTSSAFAKYKSCMLRLISPSYPIFTNNFPRTFQTIP
ncbi:hypothetical protein DSO57_1037037 [Entomophthora muscae]|uniref:Uncharacterized protein n=1 Tax=Entomophthora muscae TaxID=34485 RepID=A0ACC2RQ16_9FUNG|nr:hypothetical protein DSO57_1037037 [Entomophthora muscae]